MQLRDYQLNIIERVHSQWSAGAQNVLAQLPTGAGKTIVFTEIVATHQGAAIAIAHRIELVSQISLALARRGIYHTLIAQKPHIREIVSLHMSELGASYYRPSAAVRVAGVDTLLRWHDTSWFASISLVIQDEAHHVLTKNKWGKAASFFPTARGLYVTATPCRADGHGLGRHADGVIDVMIEGPPMRHLISQGYLSDYRIFAPPSDLDLTTVAIGASGEYSQEPLRTAVHKSHITGDVVSHYLRLAPGKLGVTFAVDIQAATEIAAAFKAAGVPCEMITGKTPDLLRAHLMRRFRNREILQLVNVDLLGEGVDVPAIEVVSFARPTASYALYSQQFGRSLRPLEGKSHALIIDHVGNVMRHGLPDAPRLWSLDRRERRTKKYDPELALANCLQCFSVYPRVKRQCPHCGFYAAPAQRHAPEFVDGDLTELDADVLARMRGERDRIDGPAHPPVNLPVPAQLAIVKRHKARQAAQFELRDAIATWASPLHARGIDDGEIYRTFYLKYGIDIMTAQTLGAKDAELLSLKIVGSLDGSASGVDR